MRRRFLFITLVVFVVIGLANSCEYDGVNGSATSGSSLITSSGARPYQNEDVGNDTSEKLHITISLTRLNGATREYSIDTDQTTLRNALAQEGLISYNAAGYFVKVFDGVYEKDTAWAFYAEGERLTTYIDYTSIKDGDHFDVIQQSIDMPEEVFWDDEPSGYCPQCKEPYYITGLGTEGLTCNCGCHWMPLCEVCNAYEANSLWDDENNCWVCMVCGESWTS